MKITLDQIVELEKKGTLGGILDINEKIYHDPRCPGLSQSTLKNFRNSPELCEYLKLNPQPQTAAMKFGSAAHTVLLEPNLFKTRFICYPNQPEFEGQSKAAKELRASFQKEHEDKKIITQDDFQELGAMMESFYSHALAPSLLKGLKEQTFFWKDELTGLTCKARPDAVNISQKMLVDIKTANDVSTVGIQRALMNYGYYLQASHYRKGVNSVIDDRIEDFVFVFIETKAPYQIRIVRMNERAMELGDLHLKDTLVEYAKCQKTGIWKKETEIEELDLPGWAYAQSDSALEGVE